MDTPKPSGLVWARHRVELKHLTDKVAKMSEIVIANSLTIQAYQDLINQLFMRIEDLESLLNPK